ncbi:PREDICTED: uncharacterized protein LOC108778845 [Cyphomyrmex costatus]|uniref:uncharacterized protein LOC108778845 n=1 Tax=Cyphomyrmex costatus TaxID=456900 RepID=UPI00085222A1|nr:PREDICTED: uncharacterized protein LOC108778845 [Cyphomyrmex costatus]XP_018401643.1 PREDICTED: uncharacterized protein LOC108778845 [Cyphomyrmex costatus]
MLRILMISSIIYSLDLLSAHPLEEPTKFTLGNLQNNTENVIPSKLEVTKQINSKFRNNLEPSIKSNKSQNRRSVLPVQNTTPIVLVNPIPQERIRLENETAQAILERRKPDNIRQLLDSLLTPKPLVDRIKDEEKYGNRGDKFIGIGRAFVNGYENFSNFLNTLVEIPADIAKRTSQRITQTLNELGARIVGLE